VDTGHTLRRARSTHFPVLPLPSTPTSQYSTLLQETMAYHLRELVNRHIQDKHLGTAYASASETARTLTQP
jgi:hypothetical protein